MDMPIPQMQSIVRAAAASQRAQSSMDPVKLIASDGSEIIIDRRAALVSGTIKSMLAGPGARAPDPKPPAIGLGLPRPMRSFFFPRALPFSLFAPCSNDSAPSRPRAAAGQFAESQQGEIKFPEISAKVLEKTVQYFYYKLKYTNHQGTLPPFDIEAEHALELLMAANFLDT